MLEFRAELQLDAVPGQRDLVLHERGFQRVCPLRWNEEENRCTHRRVAVPAIAPTPRDIVPAHFEMMLQVDVEDPLMEVALERYPAEGTVVICLDLKFRRIRYFATPSAEDITSQDLGVVTRGNSFEPPVGVALQGEFILAVRAVDAEARSPDSNAVLCIVAIGENHLIAVEILGENAITGVRIERASGAEGTEREIIRSASREDHRVTLRLMRTFRDDVDDSIHGIRAPQCGSRSADDFDAGDVVQNEVLNFPECS